MNWLWWALLYYVTGVFAGILALLLRSERGPLPNGAGAFGLAAFIVAWPALLPAALATHALWALEVRASDRQADHRAR